MKSKYQQVSNFFIEHINKPNVSIQSIKLIHKGLTNKNYLVTTNDEKYQVRFATQHTGINRKVEQKILKSMNQLVYFDACGNMIKTWVEGETFSNQPSQTDLDSLYKAINKFHRLKDIKLAHKMDYKLYCTDHHDKYQVTYLKLLRTFNKQYHLVLSHNDLTHKNILKTNHGVVFLDYEWANLNYEWFDYLYYLIHSRLSHQDVLREVKKKMVGIDEYHLFFISYFCLSWVNTLNHKTIKFRRLKRIYTKRTKYYYGLLLKSDVSLIKK